MQREQFLITSTEGHNAIKYKWNSARKEVQSLMQEYANANGGQYTLESKSENKVFILSLVLWFTLARVQEKKFPFSLRKSLDVVETKA